MFYACRVEEIVVLVQGAYKSSRQNPIFLNIYVVSWSLSICIVLLSSPWQDWKHASKIVVVNVWCISESLRELISWHHVYSVIKKNNLGAEQLREILNHSFHLLRVPLFVLLGYTGQPLTLGVQWNSTFLSRKFGLLKFIFLFGAPKKGKKKTTCTFHFERYIFKIRDTTSFPKFEDASYISILGRICTSDILRFNIAVKHIFWKNKLVLEFGYHLIGFFLLIVTGLTVNEDFDVLCLWHDVNR